jgi:ABC-type transport system involved in multi-copper enzyme maturation permease subunit
VPIHDLSYTHWNGVLRSGSPAVVLARAQVRAILQRRIVRFLLLVGALFMLVWIAMIYLESHALKAGPLARLAGILEVDAQSFRTYFVRQRLVHLLLCLAFADLIALDRRFRALQIYLARPLGAREYVLAKWLAIAAILSAVTWIPGLFLVAVKTILRGDLTWLGASPWLPLSILAYAACLIVPLGLVTLALSSLSRSPRQASAALFAVLVLSTAAGQALAALTRHDAWQLLSFNTCLDHVASALFATAPPTSLPLGAPLAVLAAASALAVLVLRARVRAIDVVGGA